MSGSPNNQLYTSLDYIYWLLAVTTTRCVSPQIRRFEAEGIAGLQDRPRPGKPLRYTDEFRKQMLSTLEEPPPKGQAVWDGPALAKHLKTSVHAVWRVLRKEGVCLARQRSRCVSTDPEFTAKAAVLPLVACLTPQERTPASPHQTCPRN